MLSLILKLPVELQRIIASFYGGPRYPKQDYLVYLNNNIDCNLILARKHEFRFWKPKRFCPNCGNYKYCTLLTKIRTSYRRDYLSCNCEPISGKYLLAFDLNEELQEACINWIMESIKGLYGMYEVQLRMDKVSKILQDYQCKIK